MIEVHPDGNLTVDGHRIGLEGLIGYLRPILSKNPQKPVILKTHPHARYDSMVAVLDELRQGEDKGLVEPVQIAIPTQREIKMYW